METGGGEQRSVATRVAARARTLAISVAAGRAAVPPIPLGRSLSAWFAALRRRLAGDLASERESGRLALWLPVLFTCGILTYFGAEQEPSLAAALLVLGVLTGLLVAARTHAMSFALMAAATAFAGGFAVASVQTARIAHPILEPPPGPVRFIGFVERRERRATTDRVVLKVVRAQGRDLQATPARVRLSLLKGSAPPVGTPVSQLARLLPPLAPAMVGAHDFGRAPWFAGIDAVGFGMGRPRIVEIAEAPPFSVRAAAMMARVREGLAGRIRQVLSGTPAEIAVALVTGDRAAIDPAVEESMRQSGLTHVLSISGLHMALVGGALFALARGALALSPALALGFPLKAIAAAVALAGSAFYLALSGNDVPAQRSFVMSAVVLLGILVGRPSLTARTVAVAAMVVLTLAPVSALEPGTQMSFAATLALVAAYERLRPLRARPQPDGLAARLLVKGLVFFGGLTLTSLVAGLATAPFGALHFQRLAPYGLLANLAAMPAVSLLIMPFGLIGVLLLPFGWDGLAWPVMGLGIEIMVGVSDWVAAMPGAVHRTEAIGPATAALLAVALALLCLPRGSLPALAVVPAVLALACLQPPVRPDVIIAPDARTVAVRTADGRLSVFGARSNRMLAEQWMNREGDGRPAATRDLAAAFACTNTVCRAPLRGGGTLALARRSEAAAEACQGAAILVSPVQPGPDCPARVFTPAEMKHSGTLALFREDTEWRVEPARSPRIARPWIPPAPPAAPAEPANAGAVREDVAD